MIAAWAVLCRVIGTLGKTPDVAGQLYYLGNEIANLNASMRPKLPFLAFQVFASLRESGNQVRIGGPSFRSPAVDGGLYVFATWTTVRGSSRISGDGLDRVSRSRL
jgi:hypothetical protein